MIDNSSQMATALPAESSDVYSSIQKINEDVKNSSAWIAPLKYELSKVIVGRSTLLSNF